MADEFGASVRKEAVRMSGLIGVSLIAGLTTVAVAQPQLVESLVERFDGDSTVWVPEGPVRSPRIVDGLSPIVGNLGPGPGVSSGTPTASSTSAVSYAAPNTPTHDAVAFAPTGDSLRILGSAFSGSGDDTQDSMAIQVDTAGGDFSSPQYFNDTIGAVITDTVTAIDSGAVVVSRIAYKGTNGGWSAWSDSLSTTMATGVGVLTWFCDQRYAIGDSTGALYGLPQNGTVPTDSTPAECYNTNTADPNQGTVVINSGVSQHSFPSGLTNVDSISFCQAGDGCGSMMKKLGGNAVTLIDSIDINGYGFYRHYIRSLIPTGEGINAHYYHVGNNEQSGSVDYAQWWYQTGSIQSDSGYSNGPAIFPNASGYGRGGGLFEPYGGFEFKTHHTYRIEHRWHRFKADSARVQVRVYNESGSLVATGADFRCSVSESDQCSLGGTIPGTPGADTVGQYPVLFNSTARDLTRMIEVGDNGNDPSDPSPTAYQIIGGLAIRMSTTATDWIGAYGVSPEGN